MSVTSNPFGATAFQLSFSPAGDQQRELQRWALSRLRVDRASGRESFSKDSRTPVVAQNVDNWMQLVDTNNPPKLEEDVQSSE